MKLLCHPPEVLNEDELEQIWQAARSVWARVPVRIQGTEEFCDYLSSFGCHIDGELVSFPEPVREKVLAAIELRRKERGPGRPAAVQNDHLDYCASGQALYAHDLESGQIRNATSEDQVRFSHICDMFPKLGRAHPTFIPQDVPADSCDVHTFALIIKNSLKPHRVSVYNADMLPLMIQLQMAAGYSEAEVKADPIFAAKCWYNTPFMISEENIRIGMEARRLLDRPFEISTMPVAGMATPATISGCLAHSAAEVLGCNVITMALDDRLMGWNANPLTFDMKTGIHTQTGPDNDVLRVATAQLATYIFGGEYTVGGGPTTAAKLPGIQSVMEKSLCALFAIMGGARHFGSLAVTAFADIGSVLQLIIDLELMSYFERLLRGVEVDAERIGEEVICEVAPRGAYFLADPHTAKYFREELWIPELMDRRVPMAWMEDPVTMLDNATAKAKQVMAEAENQCPLSDEQLRQIDEIVAAADAVAKTTQTR